MVAIPNTSFCQGPDVLGRSWFSAKWSFCLNVHTLRIHHRRTLNWKHIIQIQHPLLDCRGNSHKQICIRAKKRIHWGAELFKLQKQRSKQESGVLKTKPKIESEALVPGSNLTVGSCYITACAFQINIWVALSSSTAVFPEANVKLRYKVKLLHSPSALRPNYPLWLQLEARVFLAAVSVNELKGFSHLSHRALQLPAVSIAWVTTVGATQQTNNRNCQDILRWHITVRELFFFPFSFLNEPTVQQNWISCGKLQ